MGQAKSAIVVIGTSLTTVHTAATSMDTYGSLTIGNATMLETYVSVALVRSSTTYYLTQNMPIAAGGKPVIIHPRLVLQPDDVIQVSSTIASSATAIFSYWEEETV